MVSGRTVFTLGIPFVGDGKGQRSFRNDERAIGGGSDSATVESDGKSAIIRCDRRFAVDPTAPRPVHGYLPKPNNFPTPSTAPPIPDLGSSFFGASVFDSVAAGLVVSSAGGVLPSAVAHGCGSRVAVLISASAPFDSPKVMNAAAVEAAVFAVSRASRLTPGSANEPVRRTMLAAPPRLKPTPPAASGLTPISQCLLPEVDTAGADDVRLLGFGRDPLVDLGDTVRDRHLHGGAFQDRVFLRLAEGIERPEHAL